MRTCISGRDGAEARLGILSEELEKLDSLSETLTAQQGELMAQLQQAQREQESHRPRPPQRSSDLRACRRNSRNWTANCNVTNRALAEKESKLDALKQSQRRWRRLQRRHAGRAQGPRQRRFLPTGDRAARLRSSSRWKRECDHRH
ncbi:MAG: hypothetical protein QM796_02990 [Chthoniobacteraceae bacterium]